MTPKKRKRDSKENDDLPVDTKLFCYSFLGVPCQNIFTRLKEESLLKLKEIPQKRLD